MTPHVTALADRVQACWRESEGDSHRFAAGSAVALREWASAGGDALMLLASAEPVFGDTIADEQNTWGRAAGRMPDVEGGLGIDIGTGLVGIGGHAIPQASGRAMLVLSGELLDARFRFEGDGRAEHDWRLGKLVNVGSRRHKAGAVFTTGLEPGDIRMFQSTSARRVFVVVARTTHTIDTLPRRLHAGGLSTPFARFDAARAQARLVGALANMSHPGWEHARDRFIADAVQVDIVLDLLRSEIHAMRPDSGKAAEHAVARRLGAWVHDAAAALRLENLRAHLAITAFAAQSPLTDLLAFALTDSPWDGAARGPAGDDDRAFIGATIARWCPGIELPADPAAFIDTLRPLLWARTAFTA